MIREDKPLNGLKRAVAPMAGHQALVGAVLKAAVIYCKQRFIEFYLNKINLYHITARSRPVRFLLKQILAQV